ncbi:MAG: SusD/RagB family nutrient-binding outer membrane lipoprotein [Balneolaceae bacterium]
MKIKSLTTHLYATGLILLLVSCEEITTDLSHLNENPDAVEELNPSYMFTFSQLGLHGNFQSYVWTASQAMQHFSTQHEVPAPGDKYFSETGARAMWQWYTGGTSAQTGVSTAGLRNIQRVIREVEGSPEDVNKLSAARIIKVYIFHIMTDIHGDIPYSEALRADEGILQPKYDTQEEIYIDMLNELDEAASAFTAGQPTFGGADLFYNGDVVQWQQFAYSLMLRLAMRLTEVREDLAEEYVRKAIEGGVITEDADIAKIDYSGSGTEAERSPKAEHLLLVDFYNPQANRENRHGGKYSATFIDQLKETDDPRLEAISVVWRPSNQPDRLVDMYTDPEMQEGLESGVHFNTPANYSDLSEPHPNTVLNHDSPMLVMTNAETYLLLAEASLRGWYSGSEEEAYNEAVRAGMRQWALFGSDGIISADRIETYLEDNPYPASGTFEERLDRISTEKWTSLFLDYYEVWANWRRTGYPELTPANYPGNITGGTIPRRLIIPDSELNDNEENFLDALERQGVGNDYTSTVWWDPMHPQQQLN